MYPIHENALINSNNALRFNVPPTDYVDENEENENIRMEVNNNFDAVLPTKFQLLVEHFLDPYISIESTQQLAMLMQVNRATYREIINIFENNSSKRARWNSDKEFLLKLKSMLEPGTYTKENSIQLATQEEQIKWCGLRTFQLGDNKNLDGEQLKFGVKKVLSKIENIEIALGPMSFNSTRGIENIGIVLDELASKENIKTLTVTSFVNPYMSVVFDTDEMIRKIEVILNKNPHIEEITLSFKNHKFGLNGICKLMKILSGRNINILELSDSQIGDDGAENWTKYLKDMTIQELHLDSADIGDNVVHALVNSWPRNLRNVYLRNNSIGDSDNSFDDLLAILEKPMLQKLDLTHNFIDEESDIYAISFELDRLVIDTEHVLHRAINQYEYF